MFLIGMLLIKRYRLSGEYGLIMLRTKKGLELIKKVARLEHIWRFLADAGLVVAYGALAFVLMPKHLNWKKGLFGFALLAAITIFMVPYVTPFLAQNLQGVVTAKQVSAVSSQASWLSILMPLMLLFGGFFLVLLFSLVFYGGTVLWAVISTVLLGSGAMANTAPGATVLIPGVTIPLAEGIIALLIILIVHEGAHAVLGRIAKVPILSSGIVLFGVVPVGAFVEPDEEYLKKVEKTKQTRVLVAGSTSNLITALIFFLLFLGFLNVSMPYRETGLLIVQGNGALQNGTIVYTVAGQNALDYQNIVLPANTNVLLTTDKGDISLRTDADGKMGIQFYPLESNMLLARFKEPIFNFIYMTLGLVFSLNFVIGSINLLPLPFFDGYRIMELNVKQKRIVDALMYLTLAGFLLNILPHFF